MKPHQLVNVKAKSPNGLQKIASVMAKASQRISTQSSGKAASHNGSRKNSVGKPSTGISKLISQNKVSGNLQLVKEGTQQEEKDSFDLLNFSSDMNLAGINLNSGKDLENRLTTTLEGITTTYHLLTSGVSKNYKTEKY